MTMDPTESANLPDPVVVQGGEAPPRYSTGLRDLDERAGGLGIGELWVLASAPGQGRSTLATQLAVGLAVDHQVPTWLLSNRDAGHAVSARAHACLGRVPLRHLQDNRLTEQSRSRLASTRERLLQAPLSFVAEAYAAHRWVNDPRLRAANGPVAAVFDDPDWRPGWHLEQARALADTGTIVVVTLPRGRILAGDAFRCDLEADMALADVVLEVRLHNLAAVGTGQLVEEPGEAAIAVLRNRRGPCGTATVLHLGHYARFTDWVETDTLRWGND